MVLSVRMRIQWGIGRFCLSFFANFFLIRNVFWEGWVTGDAETRGRGAERVQRHTNAGKETSRLCNPECCMAPP
ncbi:hypothetical protein M758_7G170600 [Ceratodon purpureus]|uniref:Uncharacterized protein n=1 Tax=Ceratodon purpureus TaxID=3225 RepID=A0A8T0HC02_CERPU|nr:hypothetical protein KC19_7G173400 [Ceratodon purpureus]KAG0611855.1 hypothetical protein M758_7G170600 [Ceratodon purpureus]